MDQNVATIFEAVARRCGDHVVVRHGDRVVTWSELDRRAARLAGHLRDRGVGRGARVGLGLRNSAAYVETLFACLKLSATPVNVNYRYRAGELAHVLDDSQAAALVFHDVLGESVAAARLDHDVAFVHAADTGAPTAADWDVYEDAIAQATPVPPAPRSGSDELIVYTGGTTGMPKGAVWSQTQLISFVLGNACAAMGIPMPETPEGVADLAVDPARARSTVLIVPPLMHSTGMLRALRSLMLDDTMVFLATRSFDADEVVTTIERDRVTDLLLVGDVMAKPILLALDARAAAGSPADLSSLGTIGSAGATFSLATKLGLQPHGHFFIRDAIASTEGGVYAISSLGPDDAADDAKFRLAPNACLVDERGVPIDAVPGATGRLAATGSLPNGYLGDPALSDQSWIEIDGRRFASPGDFATIEADGSLTLLGRGSGVINSGGEKIYADEVQTVLISHPEIRDAVVIGVADDRWGQVVGAVVALAPDADLTEADIPGIVSAELADYKKPRRVVFVDDLQRKETGKLDLEWTRRILTSA